MFKFKLILGTVIFSLFISACSTSDNGTKGLNEQQLFNHQFGAIYQNRSYIPNGQQFAFNRTNLKGNIVNQTGFLEQISVIKNRSPRMANQFNTTYQKALAWALSGGDLRQLSQYSLNMKQMRGMDGYQNVMMTGYFSPVLEARRTPQGRFQHPLHKLPSASERRVSRAQIYAGALNGKGLEIAYTDSQIDNFFLEVQGSGYVDFGDGNLNYLGYAGRNGYSYTSIGRLLVEDGEISRQEVSKQSILNWAKRNPNRVQSLLERNASYVYFRNDPKGKVIGSAGIPLIPLASVAADRTIIPSGSVLLVEEPIIDRNGKWEGRHQFRLMVALDVGGAVKGHHLDLYQGIGKEAGHRAGLLKHYGRVWVLQ